MTIAEIIIIAIALAIDCFTVSIASGISSQKFISKPMTQMIILFGVFQGGMTALGWLGGSAFKSIVEPIDHWIAFILLSYLGIRMIYEGIFSKNKDNEEIVQSKLFKLRNILTMAIATSIDALAVGVSFAFLNKGETGMLVPTLTIALGSSLFTAAGLGIGILAGKKIRIPAEPIGGMILICIGIKILIEHLT